MKIVFVMTQSLDSPSGLGRYWPLAKELARMGYDLEVLALHYNWQKLSKKKFNKSGVKVNYVGQMHVLKEGSQKSYFSPTRFAYVSLLATFKLARALAKSDADIIQLCKAQPFNVLAAKMSHRGRPVYCDCDDFEAETNRFSHAWQRKIVRYFEDGIVNGVNGLTVNTKFSQTRYQELGFPIERICYVPNGVDRRRFANPIDRRAIRKKWQITASTPVITYIGTLGLGSHPIDLLLKAMSRVIERHPSARLLLVGGGEDYEQLQLRAKKIGVEEVTTFTGRVAPDEIPNYIAISTMTVDPVNDDLIARARSPLKILESLAMGVPVVTGDVGDRRALLKSGHLGLLVPPGNPISLFEGITYLLDNRKVLDEMSKMALSTREELYWDNLVDQFVRIYGMNVYP